MCVIVVKKPTDSLTKEDFQLFARENKDGWGFVYNDEMGTHAVRGMKLPALLKAYSLVANREAVFHFRMSTHGIISEQNCHPFEVLPGLFLLHNGIFPIACNSDKTRSDTWHFSELVLKPMLAPISSNDRADYIRSGAFRYLLETSMGSGNKIVLYDSTGPVIFNRKKWCEKAGPKELLMSNDYPYSLAPVSSYYDTDFNFGANKISNSLWADEWETTPGIVDDAFESAITPDNFVDFLEALPYDELCQPGWIVDNEISPAMLEDFITYYPAEASKVLATLAESAILYSNNFYD
jgi:Glutamine amidotransferases class-II